MGGHRVTLPLDICQQLWLKLGRDAAAIGAEQHAVHIRGQALQAVAGGVLPDAS